MRSAWRATSPRQVREASLLTVLCLLSGLRIFLCAAAIPFFANVDEHDHFDLVCKYARGWLPAPGEDAYDRESAELITAYDSPEFLTLQKDLPGSRPPPPLWRLPPDVRAILLEKGTHDVSSWFNHEAFSPPVYYLAAGGWYDLGKRLGFRGGSLLYWVRFLTVLTFPVLVAMSYFFIRRFYPGHYVLRLSVPMLLTFFPQDIFWTINADVLSPLLFLASLFLLLVWREREQPSVLLGFAAGLTVAATFLEKYTNLPLLVLTSAVLGQKAWRLARTGSLRSHALELAVTVLATTGPIAAWLLRNYFVLGDVSGSAAKIISLGWSYRPISEIGNHPLFTSSGIFYFGSELIPYFWRGELVWFREPRTPRWADYYFIAISISLLLAAVARWWVLRRSDPKVERVTDAYLLGAVGMSVALLMGLSLLFDFGDSHYPSRERPFFVSGRLIMGTLVPFLILLVRGLEFVFSRYGSRAGPAVVVAGTVVIMFLAKLDLLLLAAQSPYNWFHLR